MTRVPSMQHPVVAREGRRALFVTAAAGIALYAAFGVSAAAPAIPLFLFLLYWYRDPHRDSPSLPLAIMAPVDGRVSTSRTGHDPWLGRDDSCIVAIRMGPLDVHSVFSPAEGKLIEQWSKPRHGEPEAVGSVLAYHVQTDEGDDVVFAFSRGSIGGPLRIYYQAGERVGHGRRIGYAALGCTVTVYAPPGSRLDTGEGTRVEAAATVIATLVHETPVSAIRDDRSGGD